MFGPESSLLVIVSTSVAVVLLPRLTTLGYRLPWGWDPGASIGWVLIVLLVSIYLFTRWTRARSGVSGVG